jgi:hypothetical protein
MDVGQAEHDLHHRAIGQLALKRQVERDGRGRGHIDQPRDRHRGGLERGLRGHHVGVHVRRLIHVHVRQRHVAGLVVRRVVVLGWLAGSERGGCGQRQGEASDEARGALGHGAVSFGRDVGLSA